MFKNILVPDGGEIARRLIRTARKSAIASTPIYLDVNSTGPRLRPVVE